MIVFINKNNNFLLLLSNSKITIIITQDFTLKELIPQSFILVENRRETFKYL